MTADLDLLAQDSDAMSRFQESLREQATVTALNAAIRKNSTDLRELLAAGRDSELSRQTVLRAFRQQTHGLLLTCAIAIGAERGVRIGAIATEQMIKDADSYVENYLNTLAPWLLANDTVEDDD